MRRGGGEKGAKKIQFSLSLQSGPVRVNLVSTMTSDFLSQPFLSTAVR